MPLRDHFRPPVDDKHTWSEVHGLWPAMIVQEMFNLLPKGFQAAPRIYLGSPIEIDVSTFEDTSLTPFDDAEAGTLAVLTPTLVVETEMIEQDQYEVLIYDDRRDRKLVAAIEIVSPSNKDRPDSRELFIGKVATLLQKGVCVSIVDLVSTRHTNLYAELLELLDREDPALVPTPPHMYAVTLRSRKPVNAPALLEAWFYPMRVGELLPTIPLWLTPRLRVMLPLETSYQETCRLLRIAS